MTTNHHDERSALRTALALGAALALASSAVQCSGTDAAPGRSSVGSGGSSAASGSGAGGSSSGATGGGGFSGTTIFPDGALIDVPAKDYGLDAFFVDDPPPPACNGNMNKPSNPGGTPECPADKNLQGCSCTNPGATAPCWPGYRKHRNRGACQDGVVECVKIGENQFEWGPCENFKGIDPNTYEPLGTVGKAACGCFSGGFWSLTNTSPCFITSGATGQVVGAVSTVMTDQMGGAMCPAAATMPNFFTDPTPPSEPFTTNAVRADCQGHFKLCYTFKALNQPMGMMNSASDCVMKQVCTEAQYSFDPANVPPYPDVSFPDLPGWKTSDPAEVACAQKFVSNGGYAEMTVEGQSDECETIDKLFQTVTYCPLKCSDPANAMDPECVNCRNGGGGPF